VDQKEFHLPHVKVVTEAGAVYLLGLVSQREGEAATEVARSTNGVQKVVRVFEYVSEEEARRLDGSNRSADSSTK
jgi:osmotically-inducible protein OsmY